MLGSAALVLALAGTAGVATLVIASGPDTTTHGRLLTHPGGPGGQDHGTARRPGAADRTGARGAASRAGRPAVRLTSGAGWQPNARPVRAFLGRYFRAINHHDYIAYLRLFSPANRAVLSRAGFQAGYGTTRDVAPTMTRLTAAGLRQLAATVTFTSHQDAAAGPGHASCLRWRITIYLIRHGTGRERYFIGNPPAGYSAREHAC